MKQGVGIAIGFVVLIVCAVIIVGGLYAGGVIGGEKSPPSSSGLAPSPAGAPSGTPSRTPTTPPATTPPPSPVNCAVSGWSDSGSCSVTICGTTGGTKTQTRTVTTQPANGGAACPPLTQSVPCSAPACITCPPGEELNRQLNMCFLSQQQITQNLQQYLGVNAPQLPTQAELQQAQQANQAQQAAIQQRAAERTDWTPGTGCNPGGSNWAAYGGKQDYCNSNSSDPCCGTASQSTTQIKKPMGESCEYNDECDTGYCGGGTCMS